MTYHPDAVSWELDQLNAMACMLLCGSGDHKASASGGDSAINWIFPAYVDMADGVLEARSPAFLINAKKMEWKGSPKTLQAME